MSLRLRLTVTYSVLVALILTTFSIVLYGIMRGNLEAEADRRLVVRASQVELTIWPETRSLTSEDLTAAKLDLSPLEDLRAPSIYVEVSDRNGNPITASENLRGVVLPMDEAVVAGTLEGKQTLRDLVLEGDRPLRLLTLPIKVRDRIVGVLTVGQSRQLFQDTMDSLRTLLVVLGGAALAVAGAIGWVVADRGLQPLAAIARQAALIAAGRDFSHRLDHQGPTDEVGRLARTVDDLLKTVEETLRQHRDFVADTSHELRNPLLAIRTNLELVARMPRREQRAECVKEALQQVERMSGLVNDLLTLARIEVGLVVERRPVSLANVMEQAVHDAMVRSNNRPVSITQADDVFVLGDDGRLAQVIGNLLDNALRHSAADRAVTVGLARVVGGAQLTVEDMGDGIAGEHMARIFDRFYRVDPPGTTKNGTGLGLAIVKHLVEAHGGRVTAKSEVGKGSRFVVWLPTGSGLPAPWHEPHPQKMRAEPIPSSLPWA